MLVLSQLHWPSRKSRAGNVEGTGRGGFERIIVMTCDAGSPRDAIYTVEISAPGLAVLNW